MHPVPTDDQEAILHEIRKFLTKSVDADKCMAWEKEPGSAVSALKSSVAELGWFGYSAPEDVGGSEAGFVDLSLLYEELGRGLLPLQVINYMRGVQAVVDLDPKCSLLNNLTTAEKTICLSFDEEFNRLPENYDVKIEGDAVYGRKCYVLNAESADYHLVAAKEKGGLSLVVVENKDLKFQPLKTMADDSQAHVDYSGAKVIARLGDAGNGKEAFDKMWLNQRLLALSEMLGSMFCVLDTTVDYIKERWQFGQPIALFQAVRHQTADMATTVTACRHLTRQAITRTVAGTVESTEVLSALAYVGQAYKKGCWAGHHLHGGTGFVVEHPMHWHSERAQSYCIRYTPEAPFLKAITAKLLD